MRRRVAGGLAAAGAALALVIGASVVWPGLDAQETPAVDTSVWALQTGEGRRYARVNTAVGELDTVRSISNPSQVVQSDAAAFVFSDSYGKLTRINESLPADLDEETVRAVATSTPPGTTDVATAGDVVVYRTDARAVFVGSLSEGGAEPFEPFGGDETTPAYTADAVAVDDAGMLFAYSAADASVVRYDTVAGEVRGRDPIDVRASAPVISAAGGTWLLVDTESGRAWLPGRDDALDLDLTGDVQIGEPASAGSAVYVADESGLRRVGVPDGRVTSEIDRGATVLGTPARPIQRDGTVYAAWLAPAAAGGTLWTSDAGERALDYGAGELPDERRPVFVATDAAIVLNETRTGWVWNVPDGALVPSSQDWSLDERTDPAAVPSDEQLSVVIDPKPPVAEPDAFGVRAGRLATLPVLLNDHDPNDDVLSIDPTSVTGLDPGFGTLSLTDDGQRLAVRVAPGATGSAVFSYAATDGTAADGLLSPPTTVTLTVSDGDAAPQWCGVERCLQEWPTPEVARGGTVTVPVLPGWVDPDGDPLLLLSVQNRSGIGTVAATPAGEIVYQHSDDGAGGEQLIELEATVADTTGQTAVKTLLVRVSPTPALSVQSFARVDTIGAGITVDVASHVTGTAGALSLSSARVLDGAAASVTVVGGTTTFDLSASEPGVYRIGFTVTDGASEASGTARVTVLPADAPAQLATSPVVAFVRPQEDATLDVFAAVSNPTRRVLLLSDVVATADEGATLSVDAVGQSDLRVSGSTATGAAGLLGTVSYTVSDGTDDAGATVVGEATVYLLPPAPELAPIAVDDRVVVRAGAQIDIPVLDNDISPAGGRPALDAATVGSSTSEALAFAAGGVLRYLAPTTPGEYTVDYSVYTIGAPSLADTATVRVSVLAGDANRAPLPDRLEGRVLSGGTTTVDVDGFGMDPDGDVVTLDRIVRQPDRGAAAVSADGRSIVYTSVPGDRGQVSFTYRVSDAAGATGEGTVRIGVLDAEANPSPITFTDYVQVQAGSGNRIRVSPLANDLDPTQGALTLTAVRPDLPARLADGSVNPEYARLEAQIVSVGESMVALSADAEPGTMSFLYDVASESGNTGRGLIVVKVVRESVPDYPVVADTVLTAENREDFVTGVDVLDGRVTWAAGEVGDLRVGLWGEPEGVQVSGTSLRGELPRSGRLIPFAVTGVIGDEEVTTYAFLRVPGEDDLDLSLRSGVAPQEVDELGSVVFDMAALVALPRGVELEVGGEMRASGARPQSACAPDGGTRVRYTAGAGAPWTDACQVPVRRVGAEEWTYLSVPVLVTARDPQPELRPASLTVGPGEQATFDLREMTSWQLGRENWDAIQYRVDYSGPAFTVSQAGSVVTVTGSDRAVPGTENAAVVGVTSHNAVAPARLILRVGAAPSALPRGGSVQQQCSQASGTSCGITVIGASGEANPLPRTPLELVDVRPTGSCVGVTFRVASATSVSASWTGDAPGTTCTAAFSVRDAQGRVTAGERDGRLMLDLQGYPKAPASLRQTGFADGAVTLRVDPGESRQAYPALSGFVVRTGGQEVARCGADGVCPEIPAPNGEQRLYETWAVNAVGESRTSVRGTAWAYDAPAAPTGITWAPVSNRGEGGVISVQVSGIDTAETGSLLIASAAGETRTVPISSRDGEVAVRGFRVGANTATAVTVTPQSRYAPPPGLGGAASGAATTVFANGVGAPRDVGLVVEARQGQGQEQLVATASATVNGDGSTLVYGFTVDGRCRPTQSEPSAVFGGLEEGQEYTVEVCVEARYGGESFGEASATRTARMETTRVPTGWQFEVDRRATVDGSRAEWRISSEPTSDGDRPPRRYTAAFEGWPSSVFDRDPGILVRFVREGWSSSAPAAVTARAGSAPYQLQATWGLSCTGGQTLAETTGSSKGLAAISFDYSGVRYTGPDGVIEPDPENPTRVPAAATRVDGVRVTVDWSAQGWNVDPLRGQSVAAQSCTPVSPEQP